jgi:hypothetical protein
MRRAGEIERVGFNQSSRQPEQSSGVGARLVGRFKLEKEDVGSGLKMHIWSVESLSQGALGFSEIAFVDGKVGSIITHAAPLLQNEVSV